MREEYCLRSLSGPNSRTSVAAREGARKEEGEESCSSDLRSMLARCRTVGEEGRAAGGEAVAAVFKDASDPLRSAYREMRRCWWSPRTEGTVSLPAVKAVIDSRPEVKEVSILSRRLSRLWL
jgi:hypothetical protein